MVELRVDVATLDVQLQGGAPVLLLDLRLQATVALASVLAAAAARAPPQDAAAPLGAVRGCAAAAPQAPNGVESCQSPPALLAASTPASGSGVVPGRQAAPLAAQAPAPAVEAKLGTCVTTAVLVGQGAPPPPTVIRVAERGTSRARSTTPLSGRPQGHTWRQQAGSPVQASPAPGRQQAPPQLRPQRPVAQGQPPPPVAPRPAAEAAPSPAGTAGPAAGETPVGRAASARSSRACSPSAPQPGAAEPAASGLSEARSSRACSPSAPQPGAAEPMASGLSEVREARSLSSHALMVLNDELQRISTGWHHTREEFKRRADGISAELDEQQKARASALGELRDFQVQSQEPDIKMLELIRRLNVAASGGTSGAEQPQGVGSSTADAGGGGTRPGA